MPLRGETNPPPESGLTAAEVATLYVEHGGELRRFVIGVLRDRDLANDVLQATFAKAVELGHTSKVETRKAWLFRVALNEALVVRRRQKTLQKATDQLALTPPKATERPEDSVVRGETAERVRQALAQLPPDQRRVVRMRIYDEKPFATIAEELKVPLGTVLTRMRLGLKKLKQMMQSED